MMQFQQPKDRSLHTDNEQGFILSDMVQTPMGPMVVCSTNRGICLLEFLTHSQQAVDVGAFEKRLNGVVKEGESEFTVKMKQELKEYFNGNRMQFTVPLDLTGTAFQLSVWHYLLKIPFGTTTSYSKQAFTLGNPKAVRAVAAANAQNKLAIVVPCHRVIGANGKLTGYAGGLERKKWLLDFESRIKGIPYSLFPDEMDSEAGVG